MEITCADCAGYVFECVSYFLTIPDMIRFVLSISKTFIAGLHNRCISAVKVFFAAEHQQILPVRAVNMGFWQLDPQKNTRAREKKKWYMYF